MSRPIRDFRTASAENYKNFKKEHKKTKITYEQFVAIIYNFNQKIADHLIETGKRIKLPYGFGYIVITKYKPQKTRTVDGKVFNNLPIDWKLSKQAGKQIRSLNLHTDGYKFYFLWLFYEARLKCSFAWKFKMARKHSRKLAECLKTDTKYKDMYYTWLKPRM